MASVPSIKGSAIVGLVEDVAKLIARQDLSSAEAARRLMPEDLALLDTEIVISRWYDIRAYTRMSELLLEVEGGGKHEYLRERGRRAAQRLLEQGMYAQLEYLQRTEMASAEDADDRFRAFGRDLGRLTTMSASILNFSTWTAKADPDHERRYLIEISEARNFPEVLCWTSDGFVNQMAAQHRRGGDLWLWERVKPDRIVFRMKKPV